MNNLSYLNELIVEFATTATTKPAFKLYDGTQLTYVSYKTFVQDILKVAAYFRENQIQNQNIAIASQGNYQFFVTLFAAAANGNVSALLNPALPKEMLQAQCDRADVTHLFWLENEDRPDIRGVIPVDYAATQQCAAITLDELVKGDDEVTALLVFTSGTTGKSKIVEMTHGNLRYSGECTYEMYCIPGSDNAFHVVPRYHAGGLRTAVLCLANMRTVLIGRGLKYAFMDLPALNPSLVIMVPMMIENIVKIMKRIPDPQMRKKYFGENLHSVVIAGSALKTSVAKYLLDSGFIVSTTYGMTETAGVGTWCTFDEEHLNTIGKPSKYMECAIQDGELMIKGPAVMKGYYKDPEETAKVLEDGWIHTGDMGHIAEDGYFYLTGRKKNVIILSNGENVNPEEIEETLYVCEDIQECLVYSDGTGICAQIFTANQDAAAAFVKGYNEKMPMYRRIYKAEYTDQPLEKTGSGKIKRKENVHIQ